MLMGPISAPMPAPFGHLVQLRRLDAMAGDEDPEMALLVVSVLAVVERAVA